MFCVKCGTELPNNASFCVSCGEKVKNTIVISKKPSIDLNTDEIISVKDNFKYVSTNKNINENTKKSEADLIDKLDGLESAIAIYKFICENTENNDLLLMELSNAKEIERMYNVNQKVEAISIVKKFYSEGNSLSVSSKESKDEETNLRQEVPGKKDEKPIVLWYYIVNNERKGPIDELQITNLINSGIIARETMVWKEGYNEWTRADNTSLNDNFKNIIPASPINSNANTAVKAISDKWLWALATVPLLCNFFLSRFILPGGTFTILIMVIVIALNILFLTLDNNHLKKSGYDPSGWLFLGIVLVPVYLFVRAAKTTKNVWPGIVWCIMFILSLFV